ncbi:hypothetical protein ZOSMA_2082G00010 [Zostera marina]|uniref:Uncharacterized protein n=1 Tax=Zostera marina TaxID=29655 RepID=A0A0K9PL22_ZOSMR|nr:hypothetical protein ZOSMA_2082G00010 [Zostera marina]
MSPDPFTPLLMGPFDHHYNSHVALLAFPFGTHATPLYSLASILASATPISTFSFFSTSNSNSKFSQIPVPPNLTRYDVSDGSLQGVDMSLQLQTHRRNRFNSQDHTGEFQSRDGGHHERWVRWAGTRLCG